ncbi:uncharacterized protein LOC132708773 isoform X2 [Cylas formicarius]|nr:uncharacterized protein LOC132708773 isoform X2 [Cylas formicarius]
MESCLQPLDFRAKYTKTEIETKALELNVLHRDIENHGKIVGSVVKLCKRPDAKCNTANARRIANGLERRWHLLFLRSLEWQCYLESLSKRQHTRNSATSSDESDSDCYREPVSKYPRLSGKGHLSKCDRSPDQFEDSYSSEDDDVDAIINEGVMNENILAETRSGIEDVIDGAGSLSADSSQFTQSNKTAPNLATYYFKHEDTDSDMDKVEKFNAGMECQTSTLDETSEEEWTFTKTTDYNDRRIECAEEDIAPKPKAIPEDTIRMLVQRAEELVSPDKCRKERSNSLKMSRVNRWLCLEKRPDDSCDASGEDDERESQTSEDVDTSTMTLRDGIGSGSHNASNLELTANRAWCRSCTTQLNQTAGISGFSISESALHEMNLSPKLFDRFATTSCANGFGVNGNNSTSSTVEEIPTMVLDKTSPMRRKKSRAKKRPSFGKSDSYLAASSGVIRGPLIKSGSFSGYSLKAVAAHERHSTSDPSAVHHCPHIWCETSTTSGAESDEDARKRVSNSKSSFKYRYVAPPTDMRDESPGKCSLNATESSSLSEAWDNYQENYLSEPYSESHDSDAARRLLNFGEDYRNFIDSQSDWSAFSDMSPKFKRKFLAPVQPTAESNSDEESLKQLINESRSGFKYAQTVFDNVKEGLMVASELDALLPNCDRHLLNHITESSEEYKMCAGDQAITTGLSGQWRSANMTSAKTQEYKKLQKEISELKAFIVSLGLSDTTERESNTDGPSEDFDNEIEVWKKTLELIKNQSAKLASLNAVVHRFQLENQNYDDLTKSTLKSDISELYELFDSAKTRASNKLSEIENLLPAWKMLEDRLEQLQKDLTEDGKTIRLLDAVLTNGQFTDQTATCVRDVAKLLSESNSYQGYPLPELLTEGSFSDSGISDEGSEHEIGERQGRLAAIRRLVRQLEVGLSPDSKARLVMREKLNATEEELKALQLRCRSLIVRTAACSHPVLERLGQHHKEKQVEKLEKPDGDGDDPGEDPDKSTWFKRLFKASLAFQIVILTFVCLSCLYEPQCCDYMNNYSWSISPKLHYEGRPPI